MILARPLRLLGLFLLVFIAPLGLRALWIPDESRYAEIAREMLQTGDWVVPRLLGMHYFEKPVGGYWFNALSQALFGQNLFASRLPVAVATGLSALVVALLAQRMWGDARKTLVAAFIYLTFVLVSGMAVYITLDPQLALWLNLALLAFHAATTTRDAHRRLAAWALLGGACGMAFLVKGFMGWLLPVLVAAPYMLWQRRLGELLRYGPLAVLVAAAVAAPWALAVHRQAPDFWNFFFWNEHIRRFASAEAQHHQPFWFYLPVLLLGCVPWVGLLPTALKRAWAERGDPRVGFLLIWLVFPLVFFCLARGKLATYLLPCFAPLALLLAHGVTQQLERRSGCWLRANAGINGALGAAALIALWIGRRQGVFEAGDRTAWLIAMTIASGWLLVAVAQWRRPLRYWELSALPLWLMWVLLPGLLTQDQIDSKQPSMFIDAHRDVLRHADAVLGNDAGLSANLAWELKRSDITVYSNQGELHYGLATPAGTGRFVPRQDVAAWIASARRQGSVAVVLRVAGPEDADLAALPEGAVRRDLRHKLALVFYPPYPPLVAP